MNEATTIKGRISWQLTAPDGSLIREGEVENKVTSIGDRMYAERGAGVPGAPAVPTGMKLGSGANAPSKTGSGAVLTSYLADSHQGFDTGYPAAADSGGSRRITYKAIWGPGKATTATPITEVVIVNDTLANATSAAGATIARALLTGVATKGAGETLTVTWTHDIQGA